jgi:RNA polymerase sigma-70 factor, ECF subfamily
VHSLEGVWISAAGRSLDAPQDRTETTDQELITAINRGDESAFESLYWRYRDWVVNLAYRFTGDAELALDVMQETFLYFARKFPGFKLTAQLKTFLYPAIRNLSIAARRQKDRFHSSDQPPDLDELPGTASAELAGDLLEAVLSGLTEEHREILLLRFVDGLSLGELSAALQIPLGTVKSRLHNALDKLRQDSRTKELFQK